MPAAALAMNHAWHRHGRCSGCETRPSAVISRAIHDTRHGSARQYGFCEASIAPVPRRHTVRLLCSSPPTCCTCAHDQHGIDGYCRVRPHNLIRLRGGLTHASTQSPYVVLPCESLGGPCHGRASGPLCLCRHARTNAVSLLVCVSVLCQPALPWPVLRMEQLAPSYMGGWCPGGAPSALFVLSWPRARRVGSWRAGEYYQGLNVHRLDVLVCNSHDCTTPGLGSLYDCWYVVLPASSAASKLRVVLTDE